MKRKLLIACMALLMILSVGAVVQAQGPGEICNANGDFGLDHDTCVTCINPGQGNAGTCLCKILDDIIGVENLGFKNFGDCASTFQQIVNGN